MKKSAITRKQGRSLKTSRIRLSDAVQRGIHWGHFMSPKREKASKSEFTNDLLFCRKLFGRNTLQVRERDTEIYLLQVLGNVIKFNYHSSVDLLLLLLLMNTCAFPVDNYVNVVFQTCFTTRTAHSS